MKLEKCKELILTAGPSITQRELDYGIDAIKTVGIITTVTISKNLKKLLEFIQIQSRL